MLSTIYKLENSYPYHCFAMYVAFMGTYVAAALSNDEKGLDDPERLFPVLVGVGGMYLITRWWFWLAVGVVLLIVAAGILGTILMEYIKDYFR